MIYNKGYTLLFAVLVSALVLAVGVSILNVSRKELILTAGARNSEYAFYAADSGYECALFNDYQGGTGGGGTLFSTSTPPTSLICGTNALGNQITSPITETVTAGPTYDFSFYMPLSGSACAYVDVNKVFNAGGTATTTVSSTGYNLGWETSPTTDCGGSNNDTEKVSREIVTIYQD